MAAAFMYCIDSVSTSLSSNLTTNKRQLLIMARLLGQFGSICDQKGVPDSTSNVLWGHKGCLAMLCRTNVSDTVKVLSEKQQVHYILAGCSLDSIGKILSWRVSVTVKYLREWPLQRSQKQILHCSTDLIWGVVSNLPQWMFANHRQLPYAA